MQMRTGNLTSLEKHNMPAQLPFAPRQIPEHMVHVALVPPEEAVEALQCRHLHSNGHH